MNKGFDIDFFFESLMNWVKTGKICEDLYFTVRYFCFHILAIVNCRWLPFIRQAEKQLKPHNKQLCSQYTLREKLGIGFWLPVLTFIFPLVVAFSISFIIDFPFLTTSNSYNPSDFTATLSGYLKIMATVLATLTGLLLTVIALTIQVKTSNLAGADFLLNSVVRRRCFFPVAAFLSGTVLTSVLGIIFSNRLPNKVFNSYTSVVALLFTVSLLILVNLLLRTMQTLGSSELEQLLPRELISLLRASFRSTLRQALIEKHFSEKLADLGFARYTAIHKEEGHPTEYKLKGLGKIIAIDPAPLRQISNILELTPIPRERNTSGIFAYKPDDSASFVTIQTNGNVTKDTQLALLTKEQIPNKQITKLIRKAFIIQKHTSIKLPWQRLREVISSSIAKGESTTIVIVANALTNAFDDYLDAQIAVAGQGKLLLEDFIGNIVYDFKPPHVSELRISELASYAARNRAQDCLDELLNCIYKLAQKSFHKQNEKYFRDWIFEFYRSYFSFRPHTKESDFNIASDITRRMHWLSDLLAMEIHGHENSIEQIKRISPYSTHYLSLCLHMLKTSSERYDKGTFDSVIEHLDNFLKYKLRSIKQILDTSHDSSIFTGVPPELKLPNNTEQKKLLHEYNLIYDYKNLVYIIAGAWLMNKIKFDKSQADNLSPFIEKLIENSADFRDLLDLYAIPGMADMTTSHDNPLGFDNWDWPHSYYPKSRWGTDFDRWIRPFYQFLLLKKVKIPHINLGNIRQTKMASHDSLRDFLTKIAAYEFNLTIEYQDKPWSIEPKDLEIAKRQINKLLEYWSKQHNTEPTNNTDSKPNSK